MWPIGTGRSSGPPPSPAGILCPIAPLSEIERYSFPPVVRGASPFARLSGTHLPAVRHGVAGVEHDRLPLRNSRKDLGGEAVPFPHLHRPDLRAALVHRVDGEPVPGPEHRPGRDL